MNKKQAKVEVLRMIADLTLIAMAEGVFGDPRSPTRLAAMDEINRIDGRLGRLCPQPDVQKAPRK